jgi:Rod binding domain-containing protein
MIQAMAPMPPTGGTQTPARMLQAAQSFEAQVLAQLLQPAFAAADASRSPFGGGSAEAQWRPMLVEAFAASAARGGRGIGLTDMVLRHMVRAQEAAQSAANGTAPHAPGPTSPTPTPTPILEENHP